MLSDRIKTLAPSATIAIAMKAKELVASGVKVIDLSLGDPVLDPGYKLPQHVKDAAIEALSSRKLSYTITSGVVELKQAIVDSLRRFNGLDYAMGDVTVGVGAKQIIFNAFLSTLNAGDEVIIPCPAWVSYIDIVRLFSGKDVQVPTSIDNGFKITPAELESVITPRTKWLIINSPNNPTGSVYSREELLALSKVLLLHPQVMVMSDDIYQHILFGGGDGFCNIVMVEPALKNRVLIVDGVSKSHGMTGWRIGYGASANRELISKMTDAQSQSTANAATLSQYAAVAALSDDRSLAKAFAGEVLKKKNIFVSKITDKRVRVNDPKGAFYVFVSIEGIIGKKWNGIMIDSCDTFCKVVLDKLRIAVTPGEAFGSCGHFRASLASSVEDVTVAGELLDKFFSEVV